MKDSLLSRFENLVIWTSGDQHPTRTSRFSYSWHSESGLAAIRPCDSRMSQTRSPSYFADSVLLGKPITLSVRSGGCSEMASGRCLVYIRYRPVRTEGQPEGPYWLPTRSGNSRMTSGLLIRRTP